MRHPNTLTHWLFPVWSGDFRLEQDGATCILTVEDPTHADEKILASFLEIARKEGWCSGLVGVQLKGVTRIPLNAPMSTAGQSMARAIHGDSAVWTAIRYSDGTIKLLDGPVVMDAAPIEVDEPPAAVPEVEAEALPPKSLWDDYEDCSKCAAPTGAACTDLRARKKGADLSRAHKERELTQTAKDRKEATKKKPPTKEPMVAATVKQPYQGCPMPAPAVRRAREVLRTFSTASQWEQWNREGRMRAIGSHSGESYFVYHRGEANRRGLRTSLELVGTGKQVCVWDDRVPAEEEALATKLAVEHREKFLRGLGVYDNRGNFYEA